MPLWLARPWRGRRILDHRRRAPRFSFSTPPPEFVCAPSRIVLMILGALANKMPVALWILAIGANITVIHRIFHTWKQTEGRAPSPSTGPETAHGTAPVEMNSPLEMPKRGPILTRTAGRGG